jgi:hypothetical protein
MADLHNMRQPMQDGDRKDLTVPDFPYRLHQIDDRLFEPEVLQVQLFPPVITAAHFASLDNVRRRVENGLTPPYVEMADLPKADGLVEFD